MFKFKAIKAKEKGGLFVFSKRKTSASMFVAEFALLFVDHKLAKPSQQLDDNIGNIRKNLSIRNDAGEERRAFHIEWNERDECFCVLFETFPNYRYQLVWKTYTSKQVLCQFIVDGGEFQHELSKHSMKELVGKLFVLTEEYPEMLYHSDTISCKSSPTVLSCYQKLFHEARNNCNQYACDLSNFKIEGSFKTIPSIEETVSKILEIEISQRDYSKQIQGICEQYMKKLKKSVRFPIYDYIRSVSTGFLDMCRLARNGNESARELCNIFLSSVIGRRDDKIITFIGACYFTVSRGLTEIISDFLSEFSIVDHEGDFSDDSRECLINNINGLKSTPIRMYWCRSLFSNESEESNYNTDILNIVYNEIYEYEQNSKKIEEIKFGCGIPQQVFFNAFISARKGNKECLNFFKYISNHLDESNIKALLWASGLEIDMIDSFQVFSQLKNKYEYPLAIIWIARKQIIGIPGLLESNLLLGYEELVNQYLTGKDKELAATSLGLIFISNVPGIEQDLEKTLFWIPKKSYPSVYNYITVEKGIKIEHSKDYFINYRPSIQNH
ncbi:predicted protein [Naegleria gruberi]|uniref:Predicted protein n=1 Tax=Naegleria gruberi TaxID=5762 RepID=D2W0D9_NAEGR|nr:uncharacterized protein NAEGRDRAFT_74824 [Naegleria gruberi]EFC37457.1 predicted protein [Naegleria gruberi]|eukprot:XP_002670201.1 predicted protein [Naegleria gruberi strain NEG-M]